MLGSVRLLRRRLDEDVLQVGHVLFVPAAERAGQTRRALQQVRAQRRLPLGRPQAAELLGLSSGRDSKGGEAVAITTGIEQLALQPGTAR